MSLEIPLLHRFPSGPAGRGRPGRRGRLHLVLLAAALGLHPSPARGADPLEVVGDRFVLVRVADEDRRRVCCRHACCRPGDCSTWGVDSRT